VPLRGNGEPILNLTSPAGCTADRQRQAIDAIRDLNLKRAVETGDPEINTRIASYEMAYRMQSSAPKLIDLTGESPATLSLYGVQKDKPGFARNCLLARRLVERGVRFVQLNQGGWDAHGDLKGNHEKYARKTDQPIYGLITDLKRRGLLDSTLVVWGGEFGRTPTAEGDLKKPGRDHGPGGYTVWLAGGGVKGGQAIGATDDVGYTAVDTPVSPSDLHATILHALGLDQRSLYFEHHNRKEIVTFNGATVVSRAFGGA
jgi:hypothetical protein